MAITKEELLERFRQQYAKLQICEKAVSDIKDSMANTATALSQVTGSPTFEFEGQYYQIRKKAAGAYLCVLNGAPKGRPKGSKNKSKGFESMSTADVNDETADATPF